MGVRLRSGRPRRAWLFFDKATRAAIGKWQAALGRPSTGYLDIEGAKTLLGIAPDLSGGVWATAANAPCKLWNPAPQPGEKVTWSGTCESGRASGEGRAVWQTAKGEETYEGQYRAGRKHGKGKAIWPDGASYEGEWRDGRQHGEGIAQSADGIVYDGGWKDGKRHGKGARIVPNSARYDGARSQARRAPAHWINGGISDSGKIIG